jgi:hypothetical protein
MAHRATKSATLLVAALLAFSGGPVWAQTDDDDDEMSGGALAVLLLAIGGAVADADLEIKMKGALDQPRIGYSEAQLQSLVDQAAVKLKSMREQPGQFRVCSGRACVDVSVRK